MKSHRDELGEFEPCFPLALDQFFQPNRPWPLPMEPVTRLQRLLKHHENTVAKRSYAVERFDLLLISISGGGIYVVFETLKFMKEQNMPQDTLWLKIGAALLAFSILLNFFSQLTGREANRSEEKWVNNETMKEMGQTIDEETHARNDKRSTLFSDFTEVFNISATLCMLFGIGTLVVVYMIFF